MKSDKEVVLVGVSQSIWQGKALQYASDDDLKADKDVGCSGSNESINQPINQDDKTLYDAADDLKADTVKMLFYGSSD